MKAMALKAPHAAPRHPPPNGWAPGVEAAAKAGAQAGGFFSKDPYSCMVPENDSKWRDFVNHTFMELIDNGKYFELYDKWFGERGVIPYPMSDQVRNYMIMQSMPEQQTGVGDSCRGLALQCSPSPKTDPRFPCPPTPRRSSTTPRAV